MRAIHLFALGLLALVAASSAAATGAPGPPRATGEFTITSSRAQVAVRPAGAPTRTARSFVDARPGLTGASRAGATIVQGSTTPLIGGGTAVRYQLEVDGLPVLGAQTVVSTNAAGRVTGATGERLTGPTPDLDPQVPAATARATARLAVARQERTTIWGLNASTPEAVIFDPAIIGAPAPFGAYRAWSVEVADSQSGVAYLALVNARDGGVYLIPRTHAALDRRVCDADYNTRLVPCGLGSEVRAEGDPATGIADVDAAYDYSGDTYDFFSTVLGRDSINDAGMPLVSTVQYRADPATPYRNAFWNSTLGQMVYGEGMVSDDVAAHEITHGVTRATANLYYSYQSGAINESMSDIFGEFVDLVNGAGSDTPSDRWKMGEDIVIGVIRDMADPTAYGDPDSTQSALWSDNVPTASNWDNGGVHYNSGVGNKAAQLMVDGGTHRGQTVTGIGIEKTAKIFYRALTAGLTSGSNYSDLDAALAQACTDLTGTAGITSSDCLQVQAARRAVSMEQAPLLAPTPRAEVCTTGVRSSLFYDDLESGGANWTSTDPSRAGRTSGYAASGTSMLYLPDPATAVDMSVALSREDLELPANAFLRFEHAYLFDATYGPSTLYDGGVVEIRQQTDGAWGAWTDAGALIDSGGGYTGTLHASNQLGAREGFGGTSLGYGSSRLDLSSYAGKEVQVRFRVGTDATFGDTGWVIDNVDIYSCPSSLAVPAVVSVSPGQVPAGQDTAAVRVTGSDLTGATSLTVGGTAASSITVSSATSLTATFPSKAPGTYSVLVTTPGGTSPAVTTVTYVGAPVITSASPASGLSSTTTRVTLAGSNLKIGSTPPSITMSGAGASPYNGTVSVVSSTGGEVVVVVPRRAVGARTLTLSTAHSTPATAAFAYVSDAVVTPAPAPAAPTESPPAGSSAGTPPAADPCQGLTGVAQVVCSAAGTRATATAAAKATLARKLAACARVAAAGRARCRTRAKADHSLATARIGARASRTVALARCAAAPAASRAKCRARANTAYRTRITKAAKARAQARR